MGPPRATAFSVHIFVMYGGLSSYVKCVLFFSSFFFSSSIIIIIIFSIIILLLLLYYYYYYLLLLFILMTALGGGLPRTSPGKVKGSGHQRERERERERLWGMSAPTRGYVKTSYDETVKILLIGESSVGKSSLLIRFADDSFSPELLSTVGIDYKIKTLEVNGKRNKDGDMGHRRPRAVSHNHDRLLPWGNGNHAGVRRHQRDQF